MKKILSILAVALLTATMMQAVTPEDLAGRWVLTKVEVLKMQDDTELSRQNYTPENYAGRIYVEQMECFADGKVVYSGRSDKTLLSAPGTFHIRDNRDVIVFQNALIGFPFRFLWEEGLFILEKRGATTQQGKQRELIRFYYQKETL